VKKAGAENIKTSKIKTGTTKKKHITRTKPERTIPKSSDWVKIISKLNF
jgi:hypothetical protein